MKTSFLISIVIMSVTMSFGQVISESKGLSQNNYRVQLLQEKLRNPVIDTIDIEGTPYEFSSFIPGNIFLNGKHQGSYLMRYNVYNDEMQVKNMDGTIEGVITSPNIVIRMNDLSYKYYDFTLKGELVSGYFIEVLKSAKADLLIKKKKRFFQGQKAKNSLVPGSPSRFRDVDQVYFLFPNDTQPTLMSSRTKKFLEALPDKNKDAYNSFIKKNSLNLTDIEDLKRFLVFYNQN